MEKQVTVKDKDDSQWLYHEACHSPMKRYQPIKVAGQLMGQDVLLSKRCCGDAGTLSTKRPDIANQLRFRKQAEIKKGIEALTGDEHVNHDNVKMLTSCPACVKGLAAYSAETGIKTDYIVVELVHHLLGPGWQELFVEKLRRGGVERVLL